MKEQEGMDRRDALKVVAMAAVGVVVGASAAGATSKPLEPPRPPGDPALKLDPAHKVVDPRIKMTLPKSKFHPSDAQTKMLNQTRFAKLTPAAAKLTKQQLLELDPKMPEKFGLNVRDIASIQEAWKGIRPPKGIGPGGRPGGLPGGGGGPAAADISCCCCTPCCCAAAVMEPVRLA